MKPIYSSLVKTLFIFSFGYLVACSSAQNYDEVVTEDEMDQVVDQYADQYEERQEEIVEEYDYEEDQLVYQNYTKQDLLDLRAFYFGFDRYDLSELAINSLPYQAEALKAKIQQDPNYVMVVEGHTDERGTSEYNMALGLKRAESVSRFLRVNGVPANNIRTVSYGEERPSVLGSNEAAWAENRRAYIVY